MELGQKALLTHHGCILSRQIQNLMARAEYLKEQIKVVTGGSGQGAGVWVLAFLPIAICFLVPPYVVAPVLVSGCFTPCTASMFCR